MGAVSVTRSPLQGCVSPGHLTACKDTGLGKCLPLPCLFSSWWSSKIPNKAMGAGTLGLQACRSSRSSSEEFRKLCGLAFIMPSLCLLSLQSEAELTVTSSVQDRAKKCSTYLVALPMAMLATVTKSTWSWQVYEG